jgi:hypothetical protein
MEDLLQLFDGVRHELSIFMNGVCDFIGQHPNLTKPGEEIVHSYKKRLKDREALSRCVRGPRNVVGARAEFVLEQITNMTLGGRGDRLSSLLDRVPTALRR